MTLPDGRRLAYRSTGPLGGDAVFLFHGSPGSRLLHAGSSTEVGNVRLIGVDRPGFGRSDPLPGRSVASWVADLTALCDALEIGKFGVIGVSAGATYALAVAALLPDRLTGVSITNSQSVLYALAENALDEEDVAALDLIGRVGAARATDVLASQEAVWAKGIADDPLSFLGDVPEFERWLLEPPAAAAIGDSFREGVRQGALGVNADYVALLTPWGFSLDDISVEIAIFYGARDPMVNEAAFRKLAARPRPSPLGRKRATPASCNIWTNSSLPQQSTSGDIPEHWRRRLVCLSARISGRG